MPIDKARELLGGHTRIETNDPVSDNIKKTKVLAYDGKFYISAMGEIRNNGSKVLKQIFAKSFVTRQINVNDDPGDLDVTTGHRIGKHNWAFYGSQTTDEDPPVGRLIEVSDPTQHPTQYLYIWGTVGEDDVHTPLDYEFAQYDEVELHLTLSTETNNHDKSP
jgi:hypothetical protein